MPAAVDGAWATGYGGGSGGSVWIDAAVLHGGGEIRANGSDTAPVAEAVPATTSAQTLTLSGTREANTEIWINGTQAVASSAVTSWSHQLALVPGSNSFAIEARDCVGNRSPAVSVSTIYDYEPHSGVSSTATVITDRLVPGVPQDFRLTLTGSGIFAEWTAITPQFPGDEHVRYRLYRSDANPLTALDGLTPLQERIPNPYALDGTPSETERSYLVTAVDAAGNESDPSSSAYLNAHLLPVAGITIVRGEGGAPVISWTPTCAAGTASAKPRTTCGAASSAA